MEPVTQTILIAILSGLTLWFIKQFLQSYFSTRIDTTLGNLREFRLDFEKHLIECEKIPKGEIIQRLDEMNRRLIESKEDLKELKTDLKNEVGFQRTRYHELNNNLTKITLLLNQVTSRKVET